MLEEWTFQQHRCENLKSSTPYLFMHCIYNNGFNNAKLIKLESLYWSTNTLDVKFFYISRRLDKKIYNFLWSKSDLLSWIFSHWFLPFIPKLWLHTN